MEIVTEDHNPQPACPSITTMMSILAEAYETGAYYLNDEKCTCSDFDKLWDIVEKYGAAHIFG
ncbi:MAG: hypothetical protein WBA77_08860 [Microcoleaceae cyanobacterium]